MFKNPVDPGCLTAFFHCSTHNWKASCNALSSSKGKGSCAFLAVQDSMEIQFGWAQMVACCGRDKDRKPKYSSMCEEAILLNKWAVPKTINKQLHHLAREFKLLTGGSFW
jgi:hypothetical protein